MQEKLELQNNLFENIKKYNSNLAFAKFRTKNKLYFIGFNQNYDDYDYIDLK